jgi:hypothetical protein
MKRCLGWIVAKGLPQTDRRVLQHISCFDPAANTHELAAKHRMGETLDPGSGKCHQLLTRGCVTLSKPVELHT